MKQSITTQVQDLTQSLHSTQGQVDTVQQELAVQKDTIRIVKTELKNEQAQNMRLTAEVKRLNEDLLNLETYSRKHNLIIDGLKEVQDEDIQIVVGNFIKLGCVSQPLSCAKIFTTVSLNTGKITTTPTLSLGHRDDSQINQYIHLESKCIHIRRHVASFNNCMG